MPNIKVLITASALAVSGLLVGAAPGAAGESSGAFRCSGGTQAAPNFVNINPGTYDSITISQFCAVSLPATGTVRDEGGLTMNGGGLLNAGALVGNPPSPTASLIVEGNFKMVNSMFVDIGCGAGNGCTLATGSVFRVEGNVDSRGTIDLHMHGLQIDGNVSIRGGGGGAYCFPVVAGDFGFHFTTLEDSQVGGNVTISDIKSCWSGLARDHVEGNVRVVNNQLADPDAIEILANVIDGNLSCRGNQLFDFTATPAAPPVLNNPWDSVEAGFPDLFPRVPEPNTVQGKRSGQCVLASPATMGGPLGPGPF
ncbi:MAG: hypothetical protein ABI959_09050 [Candidatus Dormiibacterota bacterium]